MGQMKNLEIRIDEIMEKIEELLSEDDEIRKSFIYCHLSTRCRLKADQLAFELSRAYKEKQYRLKKENKND